MKMRWIVKMIVGFIVFFIAMGAVVMWMWNWLVPDLFHGPVINFYQAIGLLLLSKILFKGFHGMGRGGMYQNKWSPWKKHWEKMNPEEREKMKVLWKKRCGGFNCDDEEKKDDGKI